MRAKLFTSSLALSVASLGAMSTPAYAEDYKETSTPGALVGGSFLVVAAELGFHSGSATVIRGEPRAAISGTFGMARLSTGLLLRVTRFGAEAGVEASMALGYIPAKAFGDGHKGFALDLMGGVIVVPLRADFLGGFAFKMNAGIGTDHDVDYLYAGARLGFGEDTKKGNIGVEPSYRYRVGDAPTNATLLEHTLGLNTRIHGLAFSVSYIFGESTHTDPNSTPPSEMLQPHTLRKGTYDQWMFTLGYAWR